MTNSIALYGRAIFSAGLICISLAGCSGSGGADPETTVVPVLQAATPTTPIIPIDVDPGDDTRPDDVNPISPVRGINRPRPPRPPRPNPRPDLEERTIDGSNNNLSTPSMGSALTALRRMSFAAYDDGVSSLAGVDRPNARAISSAVAAQETDHTNSYGTTDFMWQWGQFIDHDIDLTDGVDPAEPANIAVPTGDPWFDPDGTGTVVIAMNRSLYIEDETPRQQQNEISSWIDASNVYGSQEERANVLRTLDGTGQLQVSDGNFLPFNEEGLPNAGGSGAELFLAGDVRANEQTGLAVMHTLFVREHNRLARRYAQRNARWSGDEIYAKARQIVGAQMQVITYREFLPALLGPDAVGRYDGYDASEEGGIANEFAHGAYRLGHSMLSEFVLRLDADGDETEHGHLALRRAFFRPGAILDEGGLEPVLRGLATQRHQRIDVKVVDDVRNFLFGAPGQGGFDLATLNIQRGRDHGLPGYNAVRDALGLGAITEFDDISSDSDVVASLRSVYDDVDDIDLWVGGLAEDAIGQGQLGELFHFIVSDQFRRLRTADRYWYALTLTRDERDEVESRSLADIIRDNTDIDDELQDDVFRAP